MFPGFYTNSMASPPLGRAVLTSLVSDSKLQQNCIFDCLVFPIKNQYLYTIIEFCRLDLEAYLAPKVWESDR
jgi:hypothetical protein